MDKPRRAVSLRQADADYRHGAALARPAKRRVAVLGEFNSGKTTLVNALAGGPALIPSCLAHTAHPTVVGYATRPSLTAEIASRRRVPLHSLDEPAPDGVRRLHVGLPLPPLRSLILIDTPGLGLADEDTDPRILTVCRTADMVIWCTPAIQAWKASEERIWLELSERVRARGVLAVTFADAVASPEAMDRLMARLKTAAGPFFHTVVTADACADLIRQPLSS